MEERAITSSSTVVASARQVSTGVEGEVVILDFEGGIYYGLDSVGAKAWEHMAQPVTVAELRDRLVEEFEVEPDQCEADLRELLGELAEAGLIEVGALGSGG